MNAPSLPRSPSWWRTHRLDVAALAVVIVLAFGAGLYTLGLYALDPANTQWVWGDLAVVYIAWSQLLGDAHASWLSSDTMSYPLQMSFSLFDPMPIFLVVAKALNGFNLSGQYLGIYFLLCMLLQAAFGYLALREVVRLSGRDLSPVLRAYIPAVGSLLWLLMPIISHRFLGHTALASKWVLTLAIWSLLATLEGSFRRWLLCNGAVLFLTCGINPYLAVMVVGSGAIVLADIVISRKAWRNGIATGCVYLAIGIGSLWLFGFLGGASVVGGSFGQYSMNVLGPFDSNGSARLLPLDISDPTGGQTFEGYNYLGVGVLALFVAAFALVLLARPSGKFPRAWLIVIVVAFTLFAVSNVVTVGGAQLTIPLPDAVSDLLSRFRAGGRMFWISAFWLLAASIAIVVATLGPRWAAAVLTALLLVQAVDVQPIARATREHLAGFQREAPLSVPADVDLASAKALIVYPPFQCDPLGTPGGIRNYEMLGFFSIETHVKLNSYYAARTTKDQKRFHCDPKRLVRRMSTKNIYLLSATANEALGPSFAKSFTGVPSSLGDGSILYYPTQDNPEQPRGEATE